MDRGALPGEMGYNLLSVALTFGAGDGAASSVFAGRYHTCVSGTEGGVACFGINNGGQLGAETDDTVLGDEPGEVEAIATIDLGFDAVVSAVPAPGAGVPLETISPTPGPTTESVTTLETASPTKSVGVV